MMPLRSFVLLAAVLLVATARRPLHRVPRGAPSTGSYIVVLRDGTSEKSFEQLQRAATDASEEAPVVTRTVGKTITAKLTPEMLEEMRHRPEVDHVEEEGMAYGDQSTDLPWYLDRLDQPRLPLDYQNQPIASGEGVDIYILDSGINYHHDVFQKRAKFAGYDPMDNHYRHRPSQNGSDCHGHGTHVASLAGGNKYGTAKKANLFSVRVLDCRNRAPWSVVLDGLDYVAKMIKARKRLAVVSMSLGGARQESANMAATALYKMGVPVVVAAGNSRVNACDSTPAGAEGVITVGGTGNSDNLYPSTNLGRCVDIFAPGHYITAAGHLCHNCTRSLSGTSMAAPLVSGAVATYLQQYPLLSPDKLLELLINRSAKNVINFHSGSFTENLLRETPNRLLQVHGCGGVYPIRTKLTIQSPSYPNPYPPFLSCEWKVMTVEREDIEVIITFLDLEAGFDKLLVCNGLQCSEEVATRKYTGHYNNTSSTREVQFPVGASYLNTSSVLRYRSSGNITVLLLTDWSGSGRGFTARITKYYTGTNIAVPDSGRLLPIPPPPTYPPITHVVFAIPARNIRDVISQWKRNGFNIAWIDMYKHLPNATDHHYNIIVHNSTIRTREFLDITKEELARQVHLQETDGYFVWKISGKLRSNDSKPLYSVIFGHNPAYIETLILEGLSFFAHFTRSLDLQNQGWGVISQVVLASQSQTIFSSVYQRDKRLAFNITIPAEEILPVRESFYGFPFDIFTRITLLKASANFHPIQVNTYNLPNFGSQFSVVFEKSARSNLFFFRWGRNITEVTEDIARFRNSWDPLIVSGYRYNGLVEYFMMWGPKRIR